MALIVQTVIRKNPIYKVNVVDLLLPILEVWSRVQRNILSIKSGIDECFLIVNGLIHKPVSPSVRLSLLVWAWVDIPRWDDILLTVLHPSGSSLWINLLTRQQP